MTQNTDSFDLSPETARVTSQDQAATGTRKPASDEVDRARAAEARETDERGDPADATRRSAE